MKKCRLSDIVCGLLWLALLIAEAMAGAAVWRLNMLPDKYFAALAGVLALVLAVTGLLMFLPARKKGAFAREKTRPGLFRRIFAGIIAVAAMAGCLVVHGVVLQVHSTVDGITGAAEVVNVSMTVYVLDTDPAGSITDTAEYTFAYLQDYENGRTEKILAQISEEVGCQVQTRGYATLTELVDGLYQGQVEALILNSAYVTILEETEQYADFSTRTRILYNTVLEEIVEYVPPETEPAPSNDPGEATEPTEEPTITNTPFVMYISGSDTRDYYLTTSRSDVNILMVVNPETKQVLLVNTPRDYFVSNPAGNGAKDKLTHCGIYGTACSMGALELLYDVDIEYYAQINFTGVETLVDAIGGVDVYSEYGFYALEVHWIDQGWNHLDGVRALAFAQDRKSHSGGDNARGRNQMKVIQAVIDKVTTGTTIITNYSAILESIQGMFKTNVTTEQIGELVKMQLGDMASWNVLTYAVTGTGGSDITYSMPGLHCYVMYPDQETVDYGAELIDRVLAGEILTQEDMTLPGT